MKYKIIIITILAFALLFIFWPKSGVFYSESYPAPHIVKIKQNIILYISNTRKNAVKRISKVEYYIDERNKYVVFKGYQSVNAFHRNIIKFKINEIDLFLKNGFKFMWLNPDSSYNEIEFIEKNKIEE